jgi:hypothetical protein
MASLAKSEEALGNLINSLPKNTSMNESQTRFHIIDKVLTECLGWDREVIDVEIYKHKNGFTDYELGKPRIAILEAKREGEVFEIPVGLSAMHPFSQQKLPSKLMARYPKFNTLSPFLN